MFKVRFLPARFGDAIWIEYGDERSPYRILIDGGTLGTRHDIGSLLAGPPSPAGMQLDLLVVSHFDRDHIEGVLGLLEDPRMPLTVGDVWFNGWGHLPDNPDIEHFGAVQGERLTRAILRRGLPWNAAFGGRAVVVDGDGELPRKTLPGGLQLTLLSPTTEALRRLKTVWEREVRKANLDPGFGLVSDDGGEDGAVESFGVVDPPDVDALAATAFQDDDSVANGSSIAFLASYEGRTALFAADAPVRDLLASLNRFSPDAPVVLDLFKVSHHGSRNTTSRQLVDKLDCPRYVFSTSGAIHGHPNPEAVARVIAAGGPDVELIFNYRSRHNDIWDIGALKRRHGYRVRYPESPDGGVSVSL